MSALKVLESHLYQLYTFLTRVLTVYRQFGKSITSTHND